MGLADDLNEVKGKGSPSRPLCTVGVLLAVDGPLKPDDREALAVVLADPDTQHNAISRVLRSHGHEVRGDTVGRHRRGDCKCPEATDDLPG